MSHVELDAITKSFGAVNVLPPLSLDHREGRVRGAGRPLGLRQDHDAAHPRRARDGDLGPRPHQRARRDGRPPRRARHRHGVPELRALPAHDRAPEHRLRDEGARHAQGRDRRPRGRGREAPRARPLPRPQAQEPLGRPAPARRHRPRARPPAAGVPVRRAAVEPRREAPGRDADRDQAPPAPPRHHRRLRHPRPGRGDDDGRPRGRHARGPHRTGGRPHHALRTPREPVRGELHRLARHELLRRADRRRHRDPRRRSACRSRPRRRAGSATAPRSSSASAPSTCAIRRTRRP